MEHHKRCWSVIYEGDVGSAGEWCQINLHTSCDVLAPLNHLTTTVVDGARSIFASAVVVIHVYKLIIFSVVSNLTMFICPIPSLLKLAT